METKDYSEMYIKRFHLLGILFICLFGVLIHFGFELTNQNRIGAIFFLVNESVWEHLKLIYWPTLIWWIIGYFIVKNKFGVFFYKWVTSLLISIIISIFIVLAIHYIMKGAFGVESPVIDIITYVIAVYIGQLIAVNFYNNSLYKNTGIIPVIIILLFALAIIIFTYNPPRLPLFHDEHLDIYGIKD